MTSEEHAKWEEYYKEASDRDFERMIYKMCDEEDQIGCPICGLPRCSHEEEI